VFFSSPVGCSAHVPLKGAIVFPPPRVVVALPSPPARRVPCESSTSHPSSNGQEEMAFDLPGFSSFSPLPPPPFFPPPLLPVSRRGRACDVPFLSLSRHSGGLHGMSLGLFFFFSSFSSPLFPSPSSLFPFSLPPARRSEGPHTFCKRRNWSRSSPFPPPPFLPSLPPPPFSLHCVQTNALAEEDGAIQSFPFQYSELRREFAARRFTFSSPHFHFPYSPSPSFSPFPSSYHGRRTSLRL